MITQITNINIRSSLGDMKYAVKYEPKSFFGQKSNIAVNYNKQNKIINVQVINYDNDLINIIRQDDSWTEYYSNINNEQIVPDDYNIKKIKLMLPDFSVDTYDPGTNYVLTASVYIGDYQVIIGSYLINRLNALACAPIEKYLGEFYHEYIEIPIIDPYDIIYSSAWSNFRSILCDINTNINNIGTVLNLSLYPVTYNDDVYILMDNYTGSQNGLNLYGFESDDYLKLNLDFITNDPLQNPGFNTKLIYNKKYGSLEDYLTETYNFNLIYNMEYVLTIKDEDNIYKKIIKKIDDPHDFNVPVNFHRFDLTYKEAEYIEDIQGWTDDAVKQYQDFINPKPIPKPNIDDRLVFENMDGWHEGMIVEVILYINGDLNNDSCKIIDDNNEEKTINQPCCYAIPSNQIFFTQDVLKYFIGTEDEMINFKLEKINLDKIKDMQIIKIDAINKIENQIIHVDKPEDVKSNIIHPVFYKSYDLMSIVLHPDVTENICINLDAYKSKVNIFMLKIKDNEKTAVFSEIGRVPQGIIFKVIGSKLPKTTQGVYYITNNMDELITSGNYKYIK